jgi:hypothetical protein
MKMQKKHIYLDERNKRLLLYLSLLAAAIFLGIHDPGGLWLSVGLGAGVLYGLASDWLFSRKKDGKAGPPEQNEKVSTEAAGTVENKSENVDDSAK